MKNEVRNPIAGRRRMSYRDPQAFDAAAAKRDVLRLEMAIQDVKNRLQSLEQQVREEEQRSSVRDPHHPAFPSSLSAILVRRDNLKSTLVFLTRQLSDAWSRAIR